MPTARRSLPVVQALRRVPRRRDTLQCSYLREHDSTRTLPNNGELSQLFLRRILRQQRSSLAAIPPRQEALATLPRAAALLERHSSCDAGATPPINRRRGPSPHAYNPSSQQASMRRAHHRRRCPPSSRARASPSLDRSAFGGHLLHAACARSLRRSSRTCRRPARRQHQLHVRAARSRRVSSPSASSSASPTKMMKAATPLRAPRATIATIPRAAPTDAASLDQVANTSSAPPRRAKHGGSRCRRRAPQPAARGR